MLALTLLELLLVEGPTEIEKDFDLSGGYVLLFGFLKDVVRDEEQEDCYAVLLDLLLGHRCVRVCMCVSVCVHVCVSVCAKGVRDEEQEDCYAVLLDLLLGHTCVCIIQFFHSHT